MVHTATMATGTPAPAREALLRPFDERAGGSNGHAFRGATTRPQRGPKRRRRQPQRHLEHGHGGEGSTAHARWHETRLKLRRLTAVLAGEAAGAGSARSSR